MRKDFKSEFKKQLKLAIAAAVGFIIAFAWRDFILELTQDSLNKFIELNPLASHLTISIFLTFIGVLIVIISSKLLKN